MLQCRRRSWLHAAAGMADDLASKRLLVLSLPAVSLTALQASPLGASSPPPLTLGPSRWREMLLLQWA